MIIIIYTFKENYKHSHKSKEIKYEINDNGCFICVSHYKEKFGYFSIRRNGKRNKLHRYIYEMVNGLIPDELVIRHKCDNPSCINPDHLEIGTYLDNINDRVERNRTAKHLGTENGMCKLNDDTVLSVFFEDGNQYDIAKKYKISQIHVSQIKTGKRWRHLTEKFNNYPEIKTKTTLSEIDILNIFKDKTSQTRELARKYNISESAISNIRNGKKHTKITDKLREVR